MNGIKQIVAVSGMNLRSVRHRLGASLVIVVGIAGVVVVLLSFLAMAGGLTRTIETAGRRDRAIVLRRGSDSESGSSLSRDTVSRIETAPGIARTPSGNVIASPEFLAVVSLPKRNDRSEVEVSIRGVSPMAFVLRPEIKILQGRMMRPGTQELVAGRGARLEFNGLELGDHVSIRGSDWTVVGSFASNGDARESELLADVDTLMSAYQSSYLNSMTLLLDSPQSFEMFKDSLTTDPTMSVDVRSEQDYYRQQSRRLGTLLSIVAYVVGGIMAIGAMFGALSTMYSAVSARTVEIATLRAIGFGSGSVITSVMIEALLLAWAGALVGAVAAWALFNGHVISTFQTSGQVVAQLRIGPNLFIVAILWACVIGAAGGLLPAIRAARLPVASALRAI
jgi:putative ABC transport system permease protein